MNPFISVDEFNSLPIDDRNRLKEIAKRLNRQVTNANVTTVDINSSQQKRGVLVETSRFEDLQEFCIEFDNRNGSDAKTGYIFGWCKPPEMYDPSYMAATGGTHLQHSHLYYQRSVVDEKIVITSLEITSEKGDYRSDLHLVRLKNNDVNTPKQRLKLVNPNASDNSNLQMKSRMVYSGQPFVAQGKIRLEYTIPAGDFVKFTFTQQSREKAFISE